MTYEVKITGSGSKRDVISSLKRILNTIVDASDVELDKFQYEDPTLYAEITCLEESETENDG